jgi:hypothetical protein
LEGNTIIPPVAGQMQSGGELVEGHCSPSRAAAEIHGTAKLNPVFLEVKQEVSYDHIRVVFAFLQVKG